MAAKKRPEKKQPVRKQRKKPDKPTKKGDIINDGYASTAAEMADIVHEDLWQGRLPIGTVTLLTGVIRTGKSTLASTLAAAVTSGGSLPGLPKAAVGSVVWLAQEEHPSSKIKPRIVRAGGNASMVYFPGWGVNGLLNRSILIPSGLPELRDFCLRVSARLLIVDPIGSFMDGGLSQDNGTVARSVVQGLINLCQVVRCACIMTKHPRKGASGSPEDQISGSKEWINAAGAALVCARDPNDEDGCVLASLKHCQGKPPASLAYSIEATDIDCLLSWHGERSCSAKDVFFGDADAVDTSLLAEAKALLKDRLDVAPQPAKTLLLLAEQSGISVRTLRRAKHDMRITSHPMGPNESRVWEWRKPEGGWPNE